MSVDHKAQRDFAVGMMKRRAKTLAEKDGIIRHLREENAALRKMPPLTPEQLRFAGDRLDAHARGMRDHETAQALNALAHWLWARSTALKRPKPTKKGKTSSDQTGVIEELHAYIRADNAIRAEKDATIRRLTEALEGILCPCEQDDSNWDKSTWTLTHDDQCAKWRALKRPKPARRKR